MTDATTGAPGEAAGNDAGRAAVRELPLTGFPPGTHIRWLDFPGAAPARLYLHGLDGPDGPGGPGFASLAHHPALPGGPRRSLLVHLLGFGLSDRPAHLPYRVETQAMAVAQLLERTGLSGTELVGHGLGGAVAIQLAAARPDLVARLAVHEPNLYPGGGPFSTRVAAREERQFAEDNGGGAERADPVAVHRSAVALVRGTQPSWGALLIAMNQPRAYLAGAPGAGAGPGRDRERVAAAGVPVIEVPGPDAGHGLPAALALALAVSHPEGERRPSAHELFAAVERDDLAAVRDLLARGADVNAPDPRLPETFLGATPLVAAASRGLTGMVRLLLGHDPRPDVNARSGGGGTALYWSCGAGHLDTTRLLLAAGADPAIPSDDGWTPLDRTERRNEALVRLLRDHGAR